MNKPRQLVLLTRPGCHLCDEFLDEFRAALAPQIVNVQRVSVDDRAEWREAYGCRIPVLLDETGRVLGEGRYSDAVKTKFKEAACA